MADVVSFVDFDSQILGRWLHTEHITPQKPFMDFSFNRAELDLEDWNKAVRRPDVTGLKRLREPDPKLFTPRQIKALSRYIFVNSDPQFALNIKRKIRDEDALWVGVGMVRDGQGVLVIDCGDNTQIAAVPSGGLVAPLVKMLPRLRPAKFKKVRLSKEDVSRVRSAGLSSKTFWQVMQARGMSTQDQEELRDLQMNAKAVGVVSSGPLRNSDFWSNSVGGDWIESSRGSYLKAISKDGSITFEPADHSSISRLAATSLAAVK